MSNSDRAPAARNDADEMTWVLETSNGRSFVVTCWHWDDAVRTAELAAGAQVTRFGYVAEDGAVVPYGP